MKVIQAVFLAPTDYDGAVQKVHGLPIRNVKVSGARCSFDFQCSSCSVWVKHKDTRHSVRIPRMCPSCLRGHYRDANLERLIDYRAARSYYTPAPARLFELLTLAWAQGVYIPAGHAADRLKVLDPRMRNVKPRYLRETLVRLSAEGLVMEYPVSPLTSGRWRYTCLPVGLESEWREWVSREYPSRRRPLTPRPIILSGL